MAVTKRSASPEAPKPAVKPAVAAAAPPLPRVILINKASTYVTPQREIFYGRDTEGNTRVYEVTPEQLGRLLSYHDDFGKRYFKQTNAETTDHEVGTVAKPAAVKRPNVEEENLPNNDDDDDNDDTLTDTGAMRLQDEDGAPVGVTV